MCSLSIMIDSADTTVLHCEPSLLLLLVATMKPRASPSRALPLPKIAPSASSAPTSNGMSGSIGNPPSTSIGASWLCHGLQSPPNGQTTLPFQPACGAHGSHGAAG